MDFLILFLLALAFWWLAGRLIDDVLDTADRGWSRALAREELGRDDERRAA